jgi:porin
MPGASVVAQEPTENRLLATTRVAGDWGGARTDLEDRGVRLSMFYVHHYGRLDGRRVDPAGRHGHSGSVDLIGQFDLDTLNGVRGGEALIHVRRNWGDNVNPRVGALGDPIDDADGDHGLYIDQLWYQHSSPDRRLQVRFGYLDQQTILDRNAFANSEDRQFMSALLDNNNAILPLAIGPGVALFYNPADWLSFVLTASDAKSDPFDFSFATAFDGEYVTYFETDVRARVNSVNGPLTGHYRVGLFLDPRDRVAFGSDRTHTRTEGFYLSVDQMLYGEPAGDDQGAGVFVRYGWRPANVNRITHFWSGGAQYRGLFPHGEEHTLGFGMYSAVGSDLYRDHIDPTFGRETAYELYYALQLGPAVALTPAIQYVNQPGAQTTRHDLFVFALRGRVSF